MIDGLAGAPLNHHRRSLVVRHLPPRRQMVEDISQILAWIIHSSLQKQSFWSSWISHLLLMFGHLVWSCIVSFSVRSHRAFTLSIESGTKSAMARMLKCSQCHSHHLHNLISCMIRSQSISRIPSTGMMKNGTQVQCLTFQDPLRRSGAASISKTSLSALRTWAIAVYSLKRTLRNSTLSRSQSNLKQLEECQVIKVLKAPGFLANKSLNKRQGLRRCTPLLRLVFWLVKMNWA